MSDTDDFYYLQPGFDLSSLTVAKLRGILVAHDIGYPSSAKKGDLVEILETELLPQAKKLLRERDRVRRTSRGITDVPSSQEASIDDDSDARDRMPPPPTPKTPRGRKSKAQLEDEAATTTPRVKSRSKTPNARRATRTPRVVSDTDHTETERDVPRSTRTGKKNARSMTPVAASRTSGVRLSDVINKHASPEGDDSPFTYDNPFQQGSSPPVEQKRAQSRSRKSMGSASVRKSTSRRGTRTPVTLKHEEVDIPLAHLSTGADGVETTEEFTEDARHELQQDITGDRRIAKSRRAHIVRHQRKSSSNTGRNVLSAFTCLVVSVLAFWYRQEKVAVGYCGVGQSRWSLAEVENIPSWLHDSVEPQCEPCPQHATCYSDMQVQCEHDFVLTQHPLSLNGLVPIPPTCEPDSEKEKRIKIVADRAVEELRQHRAAYECGDSSILSSFSSAHSEQASAATVVSPIKLEVSEDDLKETIAKQRRKNMSPDEFEDLWSSALGDIQKRDEIEITHDKRGKVLLSSTSFANLPFTCAVRRSAIRALAANRIPILLLVLVLSSLGYGRYRFEAYRTASAQTPALVAMTLDRLATQAALNEEGRAQDSFLSVGQLRDVVLSNVIERKERERVWERVKKIVESNANVRAGTREGSKTGEWSRTWEWIGPSDFAGPRLEGRRSGSLIESSPLAAKEDVSVTESKIGGERKWNEGRAIY